MGELDRYRAIVATSVVFQNVGAADLERVLAMSRVISAKPGDLILSEGTPGDGVYIVLEGELEVFLPQQAASGSRRPTRVRLARLGAGRCVGEYGAIDDRPSSASVAALTPATLCFVPKLKFRGWLEGSDRLGCVVYGNLLRHLINRLRSKDRELDIVLLSDKP